jgi:DnaJ-class molecular chaperone with C-terminal Zn finger domain
MEPPQLLLAATRQTTRLILHPFLGKVPSLLLFLWVTAVVVISCTTTGDGTKLQWSVQAFTCHHRTAIPQLLQQQRSRLFSSSRQRMPWFLSHVHYEHDLQSKMMTRPATITTRRRTNHPFSRLLLVLPNAASPRDNDTTASTQTTTTPPLPDTTDPYQILNIFPTADRKEIKRAYRRMALLYHPDVRTNGNSTEQERKDANDDFARINTAYAF